MRHIRSEAGQPHAAPRASAAISFSCTAPSCRKVDVRLPGKGNSNSHGARPIHLIITMIKWIRSSRLSIKNSLSLQGLPLTGPHRCFSEPLETRKAGILNAGSLSCLVGELKRALFSSKVQLRALFSSKAQKELFSAQKVQLSPAPKLTGLYRGPRMST